MRVVEAVQLPGLLLCLRPQLARKCDDTVAGLAAEREKQMVLSAIQPGVEQRSQVVAARGHVVPGTHDGRRIFDAELDRARARVLLDAILNAMPEELRTVFVLFELEQLGTPQIAELLGLPRGTVASRMRRAREDFEARVQRLEAQRRGRP